MILIVIGADIAIDIKGSAIAIYANRWHRRRCRRRRDRDGRRRWDRDGRRHGERHGRRHRDWADREEGNAAGAVTIFLHSFASHRIWYIRCVIIAVRAETTAFIHAAGDKFGRHGRGERRRKHRNRWRGRWRWGRSLPDAMVRRGHYGAVVVHRDALPVRSRSCPARHVIRHGPVPGCPGVIRHIDVVSRMVISIVRHHYYCGAIAPAHGDAKPTSEAERCTTAPGRSRVCRQPDISWRTRKEAPFGRRLNDAVGRHRNIRPRLDAVHRHLRPARPRIRRCEEIVERPIATPRCGTPILHV